MKILIRYIVLLVMFVGLNGCENPNQSAGNTTEDKMQDLSLDSQIKKISYLMGLDNGSSIFCLLYTSPSPRDRQKSRMPGSA